jgi:hypothetical protein
VTISNNFRFDRDVEFFSFINSLLEVQNSEVKRSRDRSQKAKNRREKRREQAFENFIARQFSQFEHVKMKTALNDQDVLLKMQRAVNQTDSASDRDRERDRERERARERGRESIVSVEKRENVIPEIDEGSGGRARERGRGRPRKRERRRGQAVILEET